MDQSTESILVLDPYFPSRLEPRLPDAATVVLNNVRTYYLENILAGSVENQHQYLIQDYEDFFLLGFASALEERYQVATTYYEYFFFFEDFIERMSPEAAKKYLTRTIAILDGTQEPDPAVKMDFVLQDAISMLMAVGDDASRHQAREVLRATRDFCTASANYEAKRRSMTTFDEYKEYRVVDAGTLIAVNLVIWACGVDLPAHMAEDAEIQWLSKLTQFHASLLNDLYSYKVEILRAQSEGATPAEFLYNAIPVIMREKAIDTQAAMDYLKFHLFELEGSFMMTVGKLRKRYEGEELDMVIRLSEGYEVLMAGNWIWSTYCGRYQTGTRIINEYKV